MLYAAKLLKAHLGPGYRFGDKVKVEHRHLRNWIYVSVRFPRPNEEPDTLLVETKDCQEEDYLLAPGEFKKVTWRRRKLEYKAHH